MTWAAVTLSARIQHFFPNHCLFYQESFKFIIVCCQQCLEVIECDVIMRALLRLDFNHLFLHIFKHVIDNMLKLRTSGSYKICLER